MDDLLTISDLSVQYKIEKRRISAIENVSLRIDKMGQTIGLVGESGSGKTTLGLSILNLIEPPGKIVNGRVEFMGANILDMDKKELRGYRWKEASMIYQSAMNSLNPVRTVIHPIVEVLIQHKGLSRREAREQALDLLARTGIKPERANDFPNELSGGMRQRVVIALALALSPKLLIADEPTSALDVVIQKQILTLLKREVSEKGLSLLFITHEIALLSGLVEEVAVMYSGEIVERGPIEKVLFEPLHPYTEMLLGTLLRRDKRIDLSSLPRETSSEDKALPVNSCRYSNRCKYAFERCRNEAPKLVEVENGRVVACHKYA